MLQTGFLTILAVVMLHHINCAPVMNMESTTGVPISSTCEIGVPNLKATLEDSSCILDTLSETASSLRIQYSDMSRPVCSSRDIPQSVLGQPWRVFQALEHNVNLLEETSAMNDSYSDHICRLKNTVLPFLRSTLTGLCECGAINCDSISEEDTVPLGSGEDDITEFCVVETIHSTLRSLLRRLVAVTHVMASEDDLRCRVDFMTRQQIQEVKENVTAFKNLEMPGLNSPPSTPCPTMPVCTDCPRICHIHANFAVLQQIPHLLRSREEQEMRELADQLDGVLPHFQLLLNDQKSSDCSIGTVPLPILTSRQCIANQLFRLYNNILSPLEDMHNLQFQCQESSTEETVSQPPRAVTEMSNSEHSTTAGLPVNPPTPRFPPRFPSLPPRFPRFPIQFSSFPSRST